MKKLTFILTFFFTATLCFGQANYLPERKAFRLSLVVDDTTFYSVNIKASAFVLPDNTVQLYSGEKVYVEVEIEGNEIKSMRSVKENNNPAKTLTISFVQHTEGRKHDQMVLEIANPFKKKLEYTAHIFLMKQNKWVGTNVLPVSEKITAFENWPDIITTIALSGWMFK